METRHSFTPVEDQLHLFMSSIHELDVGVAIIDEAGQVWFWNHWLAEKSGLSSEAATNKPFLTLFPELVESRLALAIDAALKHGMSSVLSQSPHEYPLPLFDDPGSRKERLPQAIQVTPLEGNNQSPYCLLQINDASIAVRNEQLLQDQADAIHHLSYTDPLTGIPNRRNLEESLEKEFKRAMRGNTPLSIIMVDVDHFKRYNDTYNRSAGDFCLQRIASVIKGTLRRPADLVARYGGEEFAIVVPGTPSNEAFTLADQIRRHIESLAIPHETSEVAKQITVSMGVAGLMSDSIISANGLLTRAEIALNHAKKSGRNRVVLYQDPQQL